MPKMKTRRVVAKRFRYTGTGKLRRARANRRHLLTARTRKRKRNLRRLGLVSRADEKRLAAALPYGS